MRSPRIIAVLILANVLVGVLAASVVLSPEFAAIDAAVRKGQQLPPPSPQAARAVTARPDWRREIVRRVPCGAFCRVRTELILRFYSDDELLRAYLASR